MLQREPSTTTQPEQGDPADEVRLIEAAASGDSQAFAALYDQHLERVYRYVYHWVGDRSDAEDLTQQTFLRAWQAIGRYQRRAAFIAWLLTIAHNQVISFFRKAKEPVVPDLDLIVDEKAADPEVETLATYDRLAIRRAILRLKPDQQQVVVMRFIESFPFTDIAAAMGKNQATVRVIQFRALAELRRLLAREVRA